MIKILKEIFGRDNEVTYTDPRLGNVRHSEVDIFKIKANIGFKAKVSFKKGLQTTVAWYKTQ